MKVGKTNGFSRIIGGYQYKLFMKKESNVNVVLYIC